MTTTPNDTNAALRRALSTLQELRARLEASEQAAHEPIAVIGMACRLPQASSPAAYWELLRRGGDAVTETPAERWDAAELYDPAPEASGKVATRWGGFLDQLDGFDAAFFGISPREAAQMDPQQRLLLEVAWEALEDGGQAVDRLAGSPTGVFVGVHSHSEDYYLLQAADPRALDLYSGTGTSHSVLSGRLSYLLDLRGPSLAVDTACSSSLVAVHLAIQSLRRGECTLALAGGVNVILDPTFTMVASRMRMMSPTGRCRPFDAAADGFVRSEGCAAVALKRLADATRDGDRVLAVLHGSAVNQDGHSNGLTAPNSQSQRAVIQAALDDARLPAAAIGLVEAHGTGTPLGDPIEVEALVEVFGDRGGERRCALGSAKANIGHTEGAAGVASLIKAVLTIQGEEIPPLVHFGGLNPHLTLAGSPLEIPTRPQPWVRTDEPRYAGVSSFGWSGTNAHVIVGEAPLAADPAIPDVVDEPELLVLSARSEPARHALAAAYRARLADATPAEVVEVCATAARRRSHHQHRLAIAGRGRDALVEQLDAFLAGEERPTMSAGRAADGRRDLLVFVAPGQGGQWSGMARRLLAGDAVFRDAIERCEQAFAPHVSWSLTKQLSSGASEAIDVVQPTLFAVQVALAAMWAARGVHPDAVVGHSMGEVAAAHLAGALTLQDAALVICRRSGLLRRLAGRGAMAVVGLDADEALVAIAGREDCLAVAVSNGPASTVLSGDPAALASVMAELEARGTFCRLVRVDVASHSPQVDELGDDLRAGLSVLRPRRESVPFLSTVTGRLLDGGELDAAYWFANLRQPVRFADAVAELIRTGHGRFVELSPHPVLLEPVRASLAQAGRTGLTVASMVRDGDEELTVLAGLGALHVDGYPVDWDSVGLPAGAADLPPYPWQRERFWLDERQWLSSSRRGRPADDWLGWPVAVAGGRSPQVWEQEIDARVLPVLFEHRIGGIPSAPAAGVLELMARAAGRDADLRLTDVRFERPLLLDDASTVQVVRDANDTIEVFRSGGGGWIRHAVATVSAPRPLDALAWSEAPPAGSGTTLTGHDVDALLRSAGVVLGLSLRPLDRIQVDAAGAIAELAPPIATGEVIALVDGGLQAAAVASLATTGALFVPVSAGSFERWAGATGAARAVVAFAPSVDGATTRRADVVLRDAAGAPVAAITDLVLQRVDAAPGRLDDGCYELAWRSAGPVAELVAESGTAAAAVTNWIVLGDRDGLGAALAQELERAGSRAVLVDREADLERVLADSGPVGGVAFLWGLDGSAEVLGAAALLGVLTTMRLAGVTAPLWVVTADVHRVVPGDAGAAVDQATLWGLGRTVAEEQPDRWGGLIDLGAGEADADRGAGLAQLLITRGAGRERESALRGGDVYVGRLARRALPPAGGPKLVADATYLVTGGFGVLGAEVAAWLVSHGARRLVLMGRTVLPRRAAWSGLDPATPEGRRVAVVRRLEAAGAAVHIAAVDVGDPDALTSYVHQFAAEGWPAIRGVVHAAAGFSGRLLDDLDAEALGEQLRAKVVGASTLSDLFPDVDVFVLFSSIASLLPMAGQGAYAAGNAFLDALAQRRRALGQAGLSVSWGLWAEADAASSDPDGTGQARRSAQRSWALLAEPLGMRPFATDDGLDALARLLAGDVAHAAMVPVDWSRFSAARAARPLALVAELVDGADSSGAGPASDLVLDRLAEAPAAERLDLVKDAVRQTLGRVVKASASKIDDDEPFGALGLDSLMAMELRNRLEIEYGLELPATTAWNYPTVRELAGHLLDRLALAPVAADGAAPVETPSPAAPGDDDLARLAASVEHLSDDEALLALLGRDER